MSTLNVEHLKHENSASNNVTLDSDGSVAFDTNTLYVDAVNNRVGVGNGSPTATLNVGTGYATFQMGANDSTGFHWAKDNTALNLYTGSIGSGAKRFGVDTSGRVTMPDQPMFAGRHNNEYASTFTGATIIPLTIVDLNVGSHWNASTYRFTCPVAGVYEFAAYDIAQVNSAASLGIYKNGTLAYRRYTEDRDKAVFGKISCVADDYLEFRVAEGSTTLYGNYGYAQYSIRLLG